MVSNPYFMSYMLNEYGEPVAVDTLSPLYLEWFDHRWDEGPRSCRVAQDYVGKYKVSTVFLTIDHGFGDSCKPVLWETMVFPTKGKTNADLYCDRYTSREAAVEGHNKVVAHIKKTGEVPNG